MNIETLENIIQKAQHDFVKHLNDLGPDAAIALSESQDSASGKCDTEPRSVDQQQACSESDDWRDFAAHFERREGFAPNCRDYQVITLLWYWKQSRQRLKVATERYMSAAASYHVSPWDADAIRKYAAAKNALEDVLGIPNKLS